MTSIPVSPARTVHAFGRAIFSIAIASVLAWLAPNASVADAALKSFDIPRGDAAVTLKQFASQAGVQLLYTMEAVRGVISHPVAGKIIPREALTRMFAGTDLTVVQDANNGALSLVKTVRSKRPKDGAGHTRRSSQPSCNGAPSAAERQSTFGWRSTIGKNADDNSSWSLDAAANECRFGSGA